MESHLQHQLGLDYSISHSDSGYLVDGWGLSHRLRRHLTKICLNLGHLHGDGRDGFLERNHSGSNGSMDIAGRERSVGRGLAWWEGRLG